MSPLFVTIFNYISHDAIRWNDMNAKTVCHVILLSLMKGQINNTSKEKSGKIAFRNLLLVTLAMIVFFGALSGCNRRSAKRFNRLRETYNDTFRVAIMRIDPSTSSVDREQALVIDDNLYKAAVVIERLRVTDGDTVTAFLNKKGHKNDLTKLPPEIIFLAGDSLDIEAFIVPSTTIKDSDVTAKLSLLNGYSGQLLWQNTDTFSIEGQEGVTITNSYSASLKKLLINLTEELLSIAEFQQRDGSNTNKTLEKPHTKDPNLVTLNDLEKAGQTKIKEYDKSPQPVKITEGDEQSHSKRADTETGPPGLYEYNASDFKYNVKAKDIPRYDDNGLPLFSDYSMLKTFPSRIKDAVSTPATVAPGYDSGIEQICLLVPDFVLRTPITIQAPVRSASLIYEQNNKSSFTGKQSVHVTIFDLTSPEQARTFINDLYAGATPMLLHGVTTYAVRDRISEDVSTGITIGKFAIISKAKIDSEQPCGLLTEAIIRENTDLTEFYRNTPYKNPTECKFVSTRAGQCSELSNCKCSKPSTSVTSSQKAPENTTGDSRVTEIIREVKYKIQKVEIPTPIVPEITIYIDGKTILNLVRDNKLSTESNLILRTDGSQTGTFIDKNNGTLTASAGQLNKETNTSAKDLESNHNNSVKSIADVLNDSTKTADSRTGDSRPADGTTQNQAESEDITATKGMTTDNPGARLRYDLGCRYLSTSRFDIAEKEFRLAFKMDPTFLAPLKKLHEIEEITGKRIEIPSPETDKSSVENISIQTDNTTVQGPAPVTTNTNLTINTTNIDGTKEAPTGENTSTAETNRSDTNDSILFTGLIIAVILVVIKLVFLDDVKN